MRKSLALALLLVLVLASWARAADRLIILREDARRTPGFVYVEAAFWFPVPAGKELPRPGTTSAYAGASAAELTALQNGTVEEEVYTFILANSLTLAQKQGSLSAAWDSRNTFRGTQISTGENYSATMDDTGAWRADH